jgi:ribonuclease BN (tRNA processing enzyme)
VKLVMLGTGTLVPSASQASAGVAILHDGAVYLFDLGRGVLGRMVQAGLDPLGLRRLHLTHLHPDHCCDLVPLLFALSYAPRPPRTDPLTVVAPVGLADLLGHLQAAWRWLKPPFPLEIREIGAGAWEDGLAVLRAEPLAHGPTPNLWYRVEIGGRSVAYTGDTGPTEALLSLARRVDILVAECSLPDTVESTTHMSPSRLGPVAEAVGCGTLVVTHLYPQNDPQTVVRVLKQHYGGRVILAEDLQEIEV